MHRGYLVESTVIPTFAPEKSFRELQPDTFSASYGTAEVVR